MHAVRLLLMSALLTAGCAAGDSIDAIADASRATPASSIDQEAPTLAASPDGTISTDTPGTTAAPASSTAPATVTDSTDTPTETATAPADTPTEATAAPADTATGTPTTAVPGTAPADTPTPTSTTAPPTPAVTTTVPDSAVSTTAPSQPPIDGFTVFYEATCDACHGASGQGSTGADLRASTLNIEAVIEVIRFGVPDTQMEGWDFEPKPPGLTEDEIEAVAVYVMSLRGG